VTRERKESQRQAKERPENGSVVTVGNVPLRQKTISKQVYAPSKSSVSLSSFPAGQTDEDDSSAVKEKDTDQRSAMTGTDKERECTFPQAPSPTITSFLLISDSSVRISVRIRVVSH
jgi:hypothetical protein